MLLKVTNSGPLASFLRPPFRPPDVLQSAAFLSAVGQGSLQGSTVICSVPSSSLARAGRFCHAALWQNGATTITGTAATSMGLNEACKPLVSLHRPATAARR